MNVVVDLAKWLLEKDFRAKNAASLLVALLSVVVVYFTSRHREWFQELREYGVAGVSVALVVVFFISFLCP